MKLDQIIEIHEHSATRELIQRVGDRVSKKAPVAGKRMIDRVRSFKTWRDAK